MTMTSGVLQNAAEEIALAAQEDGAFTSPDDIMSILVRHLKKAFDDRKQHLADLRSNTPYWDGAEGERETMCLILTGDGRWGHG
jgi:hypothetical protein